MHIQPFAAKALKEAKADAKVIGLGFDSGQIICDIAKVYPDPTYIVCDFSDHFEDPKTVSVFIYLILLSLM